jgi:hypothetical protein
MWTRNKEGVEGRGARAEDHLSGAQTTPNVQSSNSKPPPQRRRARPPLLRPAALEVVVVRIQLVGVVVPPRLLRRITGGSSAGHNEMVQRLHIYVIAQANKEDKGPVEETPTRNTTKSSSHVLHVAFVRRCHSVDVQEPTPTKSILCMRLATKGRAHRQHSHKRKRGGRVREGEGGRGKPCGTRCNHARTASAGT